MPAKRTDIDVDNLIELYNSGESVKQLAHLFGIARSVVCLRLRSHGIMPRGRSESMYLRMARTAPEERARLSDAAHAAVRGHRRTEEELCKRAVTRQQSGKFATPIEIRLAEMLEDRGLRTVKQMAVGSYNIDVAITEPPIAVEIFGGNWHAGGRHAERYRKRCDYLLDHGWVPVIIWVVRDYPLQEGAADYLVALVEAVRFDKTAFQQEQVIRGDGQFTTLGCNNLKYRPIIEGPQPHDHATRRFTSRIP